MLPGGDKVCEWRAAKFPPPGVAHHAGSRGIIERVTSDGRPHTRAKVKTVSPSPSDLWGRISTENGVSGSGNVWKKRTHG